MSVTLRGINCLKDTSVCVCIRFTFGYHGNGTFLKPHDCICSETSFLFCHFCILCNSLLIFIESACLPWWRHQMETFSALLAIYAGNSPVPGEFPAQRPVTRSFDIFLIWVWMNWWVNKREAGDLRRHCAHYDTTVMPKLFFLSHINTLRPRQDGGHFPDDVFKCIFLNENA